MIDGTSAYKLVSYDYRDDIDPISGAPTLVAVPKTVQEAREGIPYNTINDLGEIFLRENLREAWRLLRRNDPYDYQLEVCDAIIYSCLAGLGWQFTVMQTRQSGKNEESAFIEQYLLLYGWYHGVKISGVKFAPVHKPQVQASMDRLEGADAPDSGGLAGSVLTKTLYRKSDGYKYHLGKPRDTNKWAFLSINPTANVASQTAFTLLEGDEAQDIDGAKWERDAGPMGSWNNATVVFWGVAWTKECHIHKAMQESYEMETRLESGYTTPEGRQIPGLGYRPKLVFKIDAHRVIASGNMNYREAFDKQVARLGINHIAIQTQYLLNFVDSIGKFFDEGQLQKIFAGSLFLMRQGPKPDGRYCFAIDVAGQEENPTGVEEIAGGMHKRDATQLVIGELMPGGEIVPACFYQWVGKAHTEQRTQIKTILRHWRVVGGVVDATGLGEPLAHWLREQLHDVPIEPYKFKAEGDENKSKLGYLVYSTVHAGMFRMPRRPTQDAIQADLWDEAKYQLENLVREAKKAQKINYHVPRTAKPRKPGHVPHDDIAMALFLLIRASWGIKDPDKWRATAFDRAQIGG